jgi:hypothetical protein
MNLAFVQSMLHKRGPKWRLRTVLYRVTYQAAIWRHWRESLEPVKPELADPYHDYRPPLRVKSLAAERAKCRYDKMFPE